MNCSEGKTCTNHTQAIEYIKKFQPEHLVLLGSCCSVRGLLGAAPRVTVLGADVDKLASMAGSTEQDRVQLLATSTPSLSLSSDPADMVYLCENADALSSRDFAELAAILKPEGCLLLSARYFQGEPPQDWSSGKALTEWEEILNKAGFSTVEALAEQTLVVNCTPDGEFVYSVSQGLLGAGKGGKTRLC